MKYCRALAYAKEVKGMHYYRGPAAQNQRFFFGAPFVGGLLGGLAGGLIGGAFYPRPRPFPVYPVPYPPYVFGYGYYGYPPFY